MRVELRSQSVRITTPASFEPAIRGQFNNHLTSDNTRVALPRGCSFLASSFEPPRTQLFCSTITQRAMSVPTKHISRTLFNVIIERSQRSFPHGDTPCAQMPNAMPLYQRPRALWLLKTESIHSPNGFSTMLCQMCESTEQHHHCPDLTSAPKRPNV